MLERGLESRIARLDSGATQVAELFNREYPGRRVLLEARARAFSAAFADKNERRDRWQ